MAPVRAGERAPDFSLPEASETIFRLSEELARGTVVLVFYPTDWGMICTLEMRTLLEIRKELEEAGARLVGVSVNSTTSHRSWKEQLGITWPLLSDVSGKVASIYGVLTPDGRFLEGHAQRSVFIIGREGIIRYAWVADDPSIQPDYQAILDVVKGLYPTNR